MSNLSGVSSPDLQQSTVLIEPPKRYSFGLTSLFEDPISYELMEDPVMIPCGHTFDRTTITSWLSTRGTCPLCQAHVKPADLISNYVLKQVIARYEARKKLDACINTDAIPSLKPPPLSSSDQAPSPGPSARPPASLSASLSSPSISRASPQAAALFSRLADFGCLVDFVPAAQTTTVTYQGPEQWTLLVADQPVASGVHVWNCLIQHTHRGTLMIGLVDASQASQSQQYLGYDDRSWGLLGINGTLWHGAQKQKYGQSFRTGSSVIMRLDCTRQDRVGELSYTINGVDMGVAAQSVNLPIKFALALFSRDDRILIDSSSSPSTSIHSSSSSIPSSSSNTTSSSISSSSTPSTSSSSSSLSSSSSSSSSSNTNTSSSPLSASNRLVVPDERASFRFSTQYPHEIVDIVEGPSPSVRYAGSDQCWVTVKSSPQVTSEIHQWNVRIRHTNKATIMLGFVHPDGACLDGYFLGSGPDSWALLGINGTLWRDGQKFSRSLPGFRTGDLVALRYDAHTRRISYFLNNTYIAEIFDNVPTPLCFAASFYHLNDTIALEKYSHVGAPSSSAGSANSITASSSSITGSSIAALPPRFQHVLSPHVAFSRDDAQISLQGPNVWHTVRLAARCHEGEVKRARFQINHTAQGHLLLGACTDQVTESDFLGGDAESWGLLGINGTFWHRGSKERSPYPRFGLDDVVTVILDGIRKCIYFSINDGAVLEFPSANTTLRGFPLSFAVSLFSSGDIISVLTCV